MANHPTMTDIKGLDVSRYDMTIDYNPQNVHLIPGEGARLDITPNAAGADPIGTRMSSTRFMQYGRISAILKAPAVSGIVITFVSMGPQLPDPNVDLSVVNPDGGDEIDWELLGSDPTNAETNVYFRGIPQYGLRSTTHRLSNDITAYHNYTIDWKHDLINFMIDDKLVRTYYKNSSLATDPKSATEKFFPDRAGKFQISIWSQAINSWAGGAVHFPDSSSSYSAYFKSITVECYDSNDNVVPKWPNSASNPGYSATKPNQPTELVNGVIPQAAAPGYQYDTSGKLKLSIQNSAIYHGPLLALSIWVGIAVFKSDVSFFSTVMIFPLIIQSASASTSCVESQWKSGNCAGPPDAIYQFQLVDYKAASAKTHNETWPPSFSVFLSSNPMFSCGRMNSELQPYQCCVSTLNYTLTKMQSVTYDYLDSAGIENNIPHVATGSNYCLLQEAGNNTFGYQSLYIRDSTCIENMSCSLPNIQFYNTKDCSGNVSMTVGLASSVNQTTPRGYLTLSQVQNIQGNSGHFRWISQIPKSLLVPNFSYVIDVVSLLCAILSVVCYFITIPYYGYLVYQRWSALYILVTIEQLMWLTSFALSLWGSYGTYPSSFMGNIIKTINALAQNLASLMGVCTTAYLGLRIYGKGWKFNLAVYVFIVVSNFAFNGSSYVYYSYATNIYGWVYAVWPYWKPYTVYWYILMMILNSLPIFGIMYTLLKSKTLGMYPMLKKFVDQNRWLMVLYCFYNFNTACYIGLALFRSYGRVLYGIDRNDYSIGNIQNFPIAVHSVIQTFCLKNLMDISKEKTGKSRKSGNSSKPTTKKGENAPRRSSNQTGPAQPETRYSVSNDNTRSKTRKEDSAYIYVGSLPFELTEGDLIAIFSQYGEIIDLDLIRDFESGKSKGFCFLGYENQKSTVLAVDNLNGIKILDRNIRVDHTEKYVKRPMKGENDQEFEEREQRRRDLVLPPHLKPGYIPESDDEEEGAAKINEDPMSSYFSEKKKKKDKKSKKKHRDTSKRKYEDDSYKGYRDKYRKREASGERSPKGTDRDSKSRDSYMKDYKSMHKVDY
ncbi:hypothetical protein HDV01_007195 [Terramyces sp. JEL0728]|nr:hypothetical protein HDV01_007195 [Terramyces sp. JEL0728]